MAQSFANFWQPFLDRADFVVLDGALATELERRGADLRDPLWSAKLLLENPALIRQVHLDYLLAGADVITSASYQATFAGFAQRGLSPAQAAQLMVASIELAQDAREEFWRNKNHRTGRTRPLVAASIGCYGAFLHDGSEYRGDYGLDVEKLVTWHRPRFEVLARSGADLLACETVPCLVEAQALVQLLGEFSHLPAWLSFSCRDGMQVCHGETLAECLTLVRDVPNLVGAGTNCTPPELIEPLLHAVAGKINRPLLVYPNSGESWDAVNHCWRCEPSANLDWTALARQWFRAGARLIGGCCRTTPETIRQIAAARLPAATG